MKRNPYLSILRTALAALLITAAAACSDDDPGDALTPGIGATTPDATNLVTVRFGSGGDTTPETRTTIDGNDVLWATTDAICIHTVKAGTKEVAVANKKYTPATAAKSSGFTPADGSEMQLEPGTYTFYSFYPYTSNGIFSGYYVPFTLSNLVQKADNPDKHITDNDFMYASVQGIDVQEGGDPKVTFNYVHAFPMLRIQNGTGKPLTRICVFSTGKSGLAGFTSINLNDGTFSNTSTGDNNISLTFGEGQSLAEDGTGSLLIFPQKAGDPDLIISAMAVDGTIYEIRKPLPAAGLAAGKAYTIDFSAAGGITTHSKPVAGDNGYQIATESDLRWLALAVNYHGETPAHATLTADIPLADYADWEPIGTKATPYGGTFNGGGKTVSGLAINRTSGYYAGLFGYLKGATINNLHVKGSITGYNTVGGIAGKAENSSITNCFASGTVEAKVNDAGGIVGYSEGSTVTSCFTSGAVKTKGNDAGGIAGSNYDSRIANCYSNATVTAESSEAGGIAGYNYGSGTTIENCYATGTVTAPEKAGGIAGRNYDGASIKNCLALGSEIARSSGATETFGRIAGESTNGATITNCAAWEGMTLPVDVTEATENGKDGADLTTAACKEKATYTDTHGFDATVWSFDGDTFTTYLPWIKELERMWPTTSETDHPARIAVPAHLTPVIP